MDLTFLPKERNLWEANCSSDCELWGECGGSATAPCGCVKEKFVDQFQCQRCHIICRERSVSQQGKCIDSFETQIQGGKRLFKIHVAQKENIPFPIIIPYATERLVKETPPLKLAWAGVTLNHLITHSLPANIKACLASPEKIRKFAKVNESTKLLAVFNTTDDYLEGFWGMKRKDLYHRLEECGFSAMTGPTFSVTKESEKMPASHNIAMMLRHNQVIDEVGETQLTPIPNLYWREMRDRDKWSQWLNENQNVQVILRDFTLVKRSKTQFLAHFEGLLEILENVRRPIHVITIGVGIKWAIELNVIERLIEAGCTCSLLASDIVFYSKYGRRLVIDNKVTWVFDPEISNIGLFESNLNIAQEAIMELLKSKYGINKITASLQCVS